MSENLIGSTTAVFPIRLSVAVASPVDVEWATRDGSAVAGSDYKSTAGTVTFLPGETEKQIEVQVYGQAITPSDDKVFFIRLNPPSNAVLVDAVLTCTINIIDDQGIPSVAVVVAEGRRGLKGDPGLSAYEQAVLMGYTGTLTEWMDQIADASKAADRAGDHAVSASEDALKAQEDALKAQNAAKNAVFAGVVFPTAAEGVDPVLGVQNGAYFNVRSPLSEHYIDEYQNVNGVAVATGKSYPTSDYVQDISEYIALPFVLETVYKLNQRVFLTNGYIVKSTVDGNTNNPNVDMTGWVYSSLTPSHNLSDVDDKAEARTNLDVYSKDEVNTAITTSVPVVADATTIDKGIVRLATESDITNSSETAVVTPKNVADMLVGIGSLAKGFRALFSARLTQMTGTNTSNNKTITCTITAHGLSVGDVISINYGYGQTFGNKRATDTVAVTSVANANTFTFTSPQDASGSASAGACTLYYVIKNNYNVNSLAINSAGRYTISINAASGITGTSFIPFIQATTADNSLVIVQPEAITSPTSLTVRTLNAAGTAISPQWLHIGVTQ